MLPAQQSGASSERGTSGGQMSHDAARPEMKSTQSEEKSPAAGKNQRAEESRQGSKNEAQNSENAEKGKTVGQSMNNEGREENKNAQRNDEKMNAQRNDENGKKNAQRNDEKHECATQRPEDEQRGRRQDRSPSTVGQAGAGAKLSTEQRTKITTVIREQHIAPVSHVNFSISVGTRVPRDVTFHPLPTEVVTIYPEWRGYEFILVGDQLVVIDPAEHRDRRGAGHLIRTASNELRGGQQCPPFLLTRSFLSPSEAFGNSSFNLG